MNMKGKAPPFMGKEGHCAHCGIEQKCHNCGEVGHDARDCKKNEDSYEVKYKSLIEFIRKQNLGSKVLMVEEEKWEPEADKVEKKDMCPVANDESYKESRSRVSTFDVDLAKAAKESEIRNWDPSTMYQEDLKLIWVLDNGGSSNIIGTKEKGKIFNQYDFLRLSTSMEVNGVKLRMITINQLCMEGFGVTLWEEGGEVTKSDGSIVAGIKIIQGLYFLELCEAEENEEDLSIPVMSLPNWFKGNVEMISQKGKVKEDV